MRVKEVMTQGKGSKTSVTVNQNESIDNAANFMRENNMKSISVTDDNGDVVGKVTRRDVLRACDDINEDFFLD